jgi:hypothetical protein
MEWTTDKSAEMPETDTGDPPPSLFGYVEPWVADTTMLAFLETPGLEPEMPQRPTYRPPPARPAPRPGIFARLLGKEVAPAETAPAESAPQPTPQELFENYKARRKADAAHALWKVSVLASRCRILGVRRVFGSYDGGGDESFTDFRGVEMSDGSVVTAESLGIPDTASFRAAMLREGRLPDASEEVQRRADLAAIILRRPAKAKETRCISDFEELVAHAAAALMGTFDAGEFLLHGVLIIDVVACTVTDEKNVDVVFGVKKPWEI